MIIQESKELHDAFLDRLKAKYRLVANRSEDGKIHLSDLTHCLTASYWDRVDYSPPTDEQALAFARGWLLEDFSIADIHVEPFEVDGVWMSVDMLLDGLPGDLKSTLLAPESSSGCAVCGEPLKGHSKALLREVCDLCGHKHIDHEDDANCQMQNCPCDKFVPMEHHPYVKGIPRPFAFPVEWERRFAAYRWALNESLMDRTSTRFGVVVFHLIQAVVKAYELRWTPSELDEAWAWVMYRKDLLEKMLFAEDPQPFKHNEDYECTNCPYNLRCGLQASIDALKEKQAK